MAMGETITVSVIPELRAFINERLRSGHYGSASEVVRAALRLLINRDGADKSPFVTEALRETDHV